MAAGSIKRKTNSLWIIKPVSLILILFLAILVSTPAERNDSALHVTREPAAAGAFYPASKIMLENMLATYYGNVNGGAPGNVRAIIAPHAGYAYSGQAAAFAYKGIHGAETIILLAPSHQIYFQGASIANATHYKTPLGEIKLSEKTGSIKEDLDKAGLLYTEKDPHEKEHAIEVQLPLLQKSLGNFELIPVLIGGATDYDSLAKIAKILETYTGENTIVIASSDFTHYGPRYGYTPFTANIEENIKNLDYGALGHIEQKDPESFYNYIQKTGATICGSNPITILLEMIRETEPGLDGRLLYYDTSGRITGDYTNSVSYVSYVFYNDDTLNNEEQEYLTTLARDTLESYMEDKKTPQINEDSLPAKLTQLKGCFVTLKKDSQLRGCIGHIFAQKPLYQCVIDNSINAAVRDSRFSPVTHDELGSISIEISVLSAPKPLEFTTYEGLLDKLHPLEDGVVISYGIHKSTYLPQVWEQIPGKEEFLTSLCIKGGAPGDCWKKETVKIETYQAQVFGE